MKTYLDANYLLRILINDVPEQVKIATKVIKSFPRLMVPSIIVAETMYALEKQYGINKKDACQKLLDFLQLPHIELDPYVHQALILYLNYSVSFYDCLILAEVLGTKSELKTFDEKLLKLYKKLKSD